jgi:hypothetical protein
MFVGGGNQIDDVQLGEGMSKSRKVFLGIGHRDLETASAVKSVDFFETWEHAGQNSATRNVFKGDEIQISREDGKEIKTVNKNNVKIYGNMFVCIEYTEGKRAD